MHFHEEAEMYCTVCGKESGEAGFCTNCGKRAEPSVYKKRERFPVWARVVLAVSLVAIIVGLSRMITTAGRVPPAMSAPSITRQQACAGAIERVRTDGEITRVNIQIGRAWVTPKFRALSFADQEWEAKAIHGCISDPDKSQLLLVNASNGSYYGSYDPGAGLVIKVGRNIVSDSGIHPQ